MPQNAPLGSSGNRFRGHSWARAVPGSNSWRRFCMLRMADCGLGRIAALTSLGRIADCTLGTLR
eukprot:15046901-Alexandrium_andersonii.AAC.1